MWARKAKGERALDEVDIPFELVGEVASAGAVTEAGHVESSSTARHDDDVNEKGCRMELMEQFREVGQKRVK